MPLSDSLHRLVTARMDPRPLGVARIFFGVGLVLSALEQVVCLVGFLAIPELPRIPYAVSPPFLPLAAVPAFGLLWIASALAFLVGWRTRLAGSVFLACSAYTTLLDQQLYQNQMYLVWLVCLLFTVADSGAAYSVDARRRGAPSPVKRWPAFLLMCLLSIVYGGTALAKANPTFLSGRTIEYAFWHETIRVFQLPDLLRTPGAIFALALLVLVGEAFLAVGLWHRRTRPAAFVLGVGLHGTIPLFIRTEPLALLSLLSFGAATLSGYLLFLEAPPASRLVLWDDSCSFCRTWVRWLGRLDWLGAHRFVGSGTPGALAQAGVARREADQAMWWVGPEGRASGFDAFRKVLESLPATFLVAPLLGLPPVRWVGHRAYRHVAARRRCDLRPGRLDAGAPASLSGGSG